MITLPDALPIDHVALDLVATTHEGALAATAGLMRKDPRVQNWEEVFAILRRHPACRVADGAGVGICIPHARTDAVTGVVMSAARLSPGLPFPELAEPVRYVFCLAIPQAMAADYLRLVGALMRIFKEPETEAALRAAPTRQAFVEALGRFEMKL